MINIIFLEFKKYIYQLLTVLGITIYTANFSNGFMGQYINENPYIYLILIFFGTAIINIINFMDGIDGLIAGSSIIIFLTIFINELNYISAFIIPLLYFSILIGIPLNYLWETVEVYL